MTTLQIDNQYSDPETTNRPPSRPAQASRPAQESALARLAAWCHDHRWWVLIAWIVALISVNVFAQVAGSNSPTTCPAARSRPSRS